MFIIVLMITGCNSSDQKSETKPENDGASTKAAEDMNAAYEANLAAYKKQITAFENKDMDAWSATIADDARWSSPAFGDTVTTRAHWVESIKWIFDNMNNLHLTNAQFLPGVDTATLKPDGSMRYYGTWNGTYKSGKQVSVKFYGTYDFNSDHKVISGNDFYDIGGMMNAMKQ
ncbi:MAG TPA: nuclear transport factor 2 family protein [Ferruginibacter sp.]|nr:nuclear transport factor 2 family protein [Ferruginibacter sp.]